MKTVVRFLFVVTTLVGIGNHSQAGDIIEFKMHCARAFPGASETGSSSTVANLFNTRSIPSGEVVFETFKVVEYGAIGDLRKFDGVFFQTDRRNYVADRLPGFGRESIDQELDVGNLAATLKFYRPEFDLSTPQEGIVPQFDTLLQVKFSQWRKDMDLEAYDLIVIKTPETLHALVYIGNNIVWQKPSPEMPAGFYEFSKSMILLISKYPAGQFSLDYFKYRP